MKSCGVFVLSKDKRGPGGRPPKYESVEQLQKLIDSYFKKCDPHVITKKEIVYPLIKVGKRYEYDYSAKHKIVSRKVMSEQVPYTITGLALHLGTTRETLLDYQEKEEFSDAIKAAKQRCEDFAERRLFEGKATGPIFNLKNNYGWKDEKKVDGVLDVRRSEYEDLSDAELKQKISEAMKSLREGDSA